MMLHVPPWKIAYTVERLAPGFWTWFVYAVNSALREGDTVTSWWRDPRRNAEVGGAADSQHLVGAAVDIASADVDELAWRLRANGLTPIKYRTHVHAQAWAAGVARGSGLLDYLGM